MSRDVDLVFKKRKGSAKESEYYTGQITIVDMDGILVGIMARTKKDLQTAWKKIIPEHVIDMKKVRTVALFRKEEVIDKEA